MKNYYEILEVHENASAEVIEKAYKVLARKYHPDIQPADKVEWAEEEFKQISMAYFTLSDPEKRIVYDFENGLAGREPTYEEKYTNLYYEQEKLKKELSSLKRNQNSKKYQTKKTSPIGFEYIKTAFSSLAHGLYNETKPDNLDRSKNIKAIIITVLLMAILLFIFWQVPVIRNFLF